MNDAASPSHPAETTGTSDRIASPEEDSFARFQRSRWAEPEVSAFVATDTVEAIAARVRGMVGELADGRIMNLTSVYASNDGLADLGRASFKTGLRLASDDMCPDGFDAWCRDGHGGFSVHLTHGHSGWLHTFGAATGRKSGETERVVRSRFDRIQASRRAAREQRKSLMPDQEHRDVTLVAISGRPENHHRDDRIEVRHWNEHGVMQHTVVTFVVPDRPLG